MFSVISKINSSNNCVNLLFIKLRIIVIMVIRIKITIKNKQFFDYKTLGYKNTPKSLFTN
jgi:hypothetical protein